MHSDSVLHEKKKKKDLCTKCVKSIRPFCKKACPLRVEYHEVSSGTCSNINKATPLSVIIFHRRQKEQNPNRWRIRGLPFFYQPLVYFYSFFYFEIGQKSIGGMIDIRWWPRPGCIFFDIPSSKKGRRIE